MSEGDGVCAVKVSLAESLGLGRALSFPSGENGVPLKTRGTRSNLPSDSCDFVLRTGSTGTKVGAEKATTDEHEGRPGNSDGGSDTRIVMSMRKVGRFCGCNWPSVSMDSSSMDPNSPK